MMDGLEIGCDRGIGRDSRCDMDIGLDVKVSDVTMMVMVKAFQGSFMVQLG
ncbi:hypothetical protein Lalb_Chr22g0358661 [Lupinus albus]|uniref:Uncharacterized protein n=1 Tax=Lupinus albus TaxID=3870 RepID=A0A6A4NQ85_LUPAL|nr:hypothetical protein Lalb_Chr22g0358661 [Lupinus albus]